MRVHLDRLTQLEYVLVHRGGRGQSFEYELLYEGEGQNGDAFLMGLLDVAHLKNQKTVIREESVPTTTSSRGESTVLAGSKRPQRGDIAAPSRSAKNTKKTEKNSIDCDVLNDADENARLTKNNGASYRNAISPLAAVIAVEV